MMIPLERSKWMVLVATIWIQAFTGTNFDFPSYSTQLKSVLEISQLQLNYLSMASDFGKLFGWCSGIFLLYFPTWIVLFMAAFLGLFGYGLQWLLIQRLVSFPYIMAFLLCLSSGCSITWFNTICFVLCIKNFPENWPLAVSLSVSFNGVTAALYNLIVTKISSDAKNGSYLILNAFLPLITSVAALIPILQQPCSRKNLHVENAADKEDAYTFGFLYLLAAGTGLYLFFLDTTSQNIFIVATLLLVLPMVWLKFRIFLFNEELRSEGHPVEGPSYSLVEINNYEELSEESLSSISNQKSFGCRVFDKMIEKDRVTVIGEEHTVRMLVTRCDFWLYFVAYFCGGTIGLVYSNNLGQISQSRGYVSETRSLVTIYSTCSFFGRLISAGPDLVGGFYPSKTYTKRYTTTRTGWLALSLVPMPIAFLMLVLSGTESALSTATGLIGISSGFVFSAAVSITSELFGSKSSGINHNILITNIPLGSLLYGALGAVIYDNQIKSSAEVVVVGGSKVCMGRNCYNETFGWWGCVSLFGLAASFLLFLRTKGAYQRRHWISRV
ncbi:protein NUCLEAR FUSION DEFECTIVE 4-like [Cynara cardunculus var. scolymus]|uniref:protein NUCLEAR FUSION DEFECTIVE 4-like n=1 Tax=Cynara cardunculus var. scolymus TaxID=59895 RepID=UPI000D6260CE|nr:protein NUCLEAR FUSION DEFECTIVE 4-like [Cynara cardunculus var. scolymus]